MPARRVLDHGAREYVDRVVDAVTGETVVDFEPRIVADEMLDASALATIRDGLTRVPRTGTASTSPHRPSFAFT